MQTHINNMYVSVSMYMYVYIYIHVYIIRPHCNVRCKGQSSVCVVTHTLLIAHDTVVIWLGFHLNPIPWNGRRSGIHPKLHPMDNQGLDSIPTLRLTRSGVRNSSYPPPPPPHTPTLIDRPWVSNSSYSPRPAPPLPPTDRALGIHPNPPTHPSRQLTGR